MNKAEEHQYDTRQLDKMRAHHREVPGEPRLHHLSGPPEPYVLSAWHIQAGDRVHAPQVIATIATNSFKLDFEVFESGILTERCFAIGDIIPDGAVVAHIAISAEDTNH